MPLINCQVGLKLKWTNYCVLSEAGEDIPNDRDDNIISTVNTQSYMLLL